MKRLYEIRLEGGRSNPGWDEFFDGISTLNGKSPDFNLTSVALVGTHHDIRTIKGMVGWRSKGLTIIEITADNRDESQFQIYNSLIENYFLPYGDYSALEG